MFFEPRNIVSHFAASFLITNWKLCYSIQARLRWRQFRSKWWTRESSVMRWSALMSSTWPQSTSNQSMLSCTSGSPCSILREKTFLRLLVTSRSASQSRDLVMSKSNSTTRRDRTRAAKLSWCPLRSKRSSSNLRSAGLSPRSCHRWTLGAPLTPTSQAHTRARNLEPKLSSKRTMWLPWSKSFGCQSSGH